MNKISRRDFLKGSVAGAASLAAAGILGGCASQECETPEPVVCPSTDVPSWLGVEPTVEESAIKDTWTTDILIIGAGNGGMAAAAYAAKLGADFRVIEQMPVMCDTRHWFGAPNSADALAAGSVTDTKKLMDEIKRYASGKNDLRVVKTWIDEAPAMNDFIGGILKDAGFNLSFTAGDEAKWSTEGGSVYMFPEIEHWYQAGENATAKNRQEALYNYIKERGYDVDFNTPLVKLEKKGNKVVGAIAQNENGDYIRINANKGVLIATGGYPGNPEMMKALDPLGTSVTTACSYAPQDKGYGIKAAIWAGAKLDDEAAPMLFDRGIVAPGVDAGYTNEDKFPGTVNQFNFGTQPFMKVNRNGVRFTNESGPYNDMSYAAVHQPGHVYAQIWDDNFREDVQRFHTIGCSAMARNIPPFTESKIQQHIEEGLLFKCDTLDELADKLGFSGTSKENFLAQCERYNELYDKQSDDDFGKMAYRLSALRKAPYYGCWLGASLLTTEQGISINEKTQALDKDCNVIEGLYVTGDASGSFFANNYPCLMPGIACGRTLTFGIKAVKVMCGVDE